MTKFDTLCTAYKTSRKTNFSYRDEGINFARELIAKYIKFLEVPEDYFRFVPMDETPKSNTTYSLFGAIHLNDDTYWHLGLQ